MGKIIKLEAKSRGTGKQIAKKLRREGLLPAIIYGGGRPEATPISISQKTLKDLMHYHGLIELSIDEGKDKRMAILKDIQYDYLGTNPVHVDFQEVKMDEPIETVAELEFVGEPKGVKEGGTLEILMREVDIKCLPGNIPEKIVVDISNLDIGDVLHVKDIPVPEGVEILNSPEETVVLVSEPEEEITTEEETTSEETTQESSEQ
ncbi:MAG TPA: 50S ribosomal protein L25 [Aquificae bacterium]|nr:50S ribosomal protein L25 [Aquificota bacterium]